MLTAEQRTQWDEDGFVILRRLLGPTQVKAQRDRAIGVAGTIDHTGEVLSVAGDALGDIPEGAVERIETAESDGYHPWTPVLRAGKAAFPESEKAGNRISAN